MHSRAAEFDAPSYTCKYCAFDVWLPIARLEASTLGLYDDDRFPGRCILAFNDHVEHLTDLDQARACAFLSDARRAAEAILLTTGSTRMNYAIFGNREPHLHFHLVPRGGDNDPLQAATPWEHPEPRGGLSPARIDELRRGIAHHLARTGDHAVADRD